jgi:peptide/nickel transport system substrate-binding protein
MKRKFIFSIALIVGLGLTLLWSAAIHRGLSADLSYAEAAELNSIPSASTVVGYTTFVVATAYEPNTLDPALDYETTGGEIIQQVYEPLLFYKREKTDEFVPMLATDWSISPNGKVYTFQIRQGVKFHNGNSLTASDVAYSLQRGILQGGTASPQWLFTEAFFGFGIDDVSLLVDPYGGLYDDRSALKQADPTKLLAACQRTKTAIQANDATGEVTLNLAQPWGPFLTTLTGTGGSILDQQWVSQHNGWDGSCSTWQNYYAMTAEEDPFTSIANGTGPFSLKYWTPGTEIVLERNPAYWRTTPMWEGGPQGPAALQQVVFKNVPTDTVRYTMLQNGEADFAVNITPYFDQLDAKVLLRYPQPDGLLGTLDHLTGTLKAYEGGLVGSASDAFYNFNIAPGGPVNFIGSGTWDGKGVPSEFFSDIHVRKAFNYAFDWQRYISEVYSGGAIQRRGPIIAGILGYNTAQPVYSHNTTLALQEFGQAWGGQVIAQGFAITLTYNTGNFQRQKVEEILKSGIEALSPNFQVNVMESTWEQFLAAQSALQLPLFFGGWMQDYPHPHNWVQPYLLGTFARRQSLPQSMSQAYGNKVYECLALTGGAAQTCYEALQNMAYLDAVDLFLAQPTQRKYLRAEVSGFYTSLTLYGNYYYSLSKGPLPVVSTVTPASDQTIDFVQADETTGSVFLPAGSVTETVKIVVTPGTLVSLAPAAYRLAGVSFDIQAYTSTNPLPGLTFPNPVTITVSYNGQAIKPIVEDTLHLFWWNGSEWEDAACGPYVRNLVQDTLQVPVCHFSPFTLAGKTKDIYLPFIKR